VAVNPGCRLQAAMVAEQADELALYRDYTGARPPDEYEEREAAVLHGLRFERRVLRDDALVLRRLLAGADGGDPASLSVVDLATLVRATPGDDSYRAERFQLTSEILHSLALGLPVPDLVVLQPQLRLRTGPDADDWIYVAPDALRLQVASPRIYPLELKGYIARGGLCSGVELARTRLQAAVQVRALREATAHLGLAHLIEDRARVICWSGYGLAPDKPVWEPVSAQLRLVERALPVIAAACTELRLLRRGGDVPLWRLAHLLPTNFQESCVGGCVCAPLCRRSARGTARELGDSAARLLGSATRLDGLVALLGGAQAHTPHEQEVAAHLSAALAILGIDPSALGGTP
jgi:hypothetical protein